MSEIPSQKVLTTRLDELSKNITGYTENREKGVRTYTYRNKNGEERTRSVRVSLTRASGLEEKFKAVLGKIEYSFARKIFFSDSISERKKITHELKTLHTELTETAKTLIKDAENSFKKHKFESWDTSYETMTELRKKSLEIVSKLEKIYTNIRSENLEGQTTHKTLADSKKTELEKEAKQFVESTLSMAKDFTSFFQGTSEVKSTLTLINKAIENNKSNLNSCLQELFKVLNGLDSSNNLTYETKEALKAYIQKHVETTIDSEIETISNKTEVRDDEKLDELLTIYNLVSTDTKNDNSADSLKTITSALKNRCGTISSAIHEEIESIKKELNLFTQKKIYSSDDTNKIALKISSLNSQIERLKELQERLPTAELKQILNRNPNDHEHNLLHETESYKNGVIEIIKEKKNAAIKEQERVFAAYEQAQNEYNQAVQEKNSTLNEQGKKYAKEIADASLGKDPFSRLTQSMSGLITQLHFLECQIPTEIDDALKYAKAASLLMLAQAGKFDEGGNKQSNLPSLVKELNALQLIDTNGKGIVFKEENFRHGSIHVLHMHYDSFQKQISKCIEKIAEQVSKSLQEKKEALRLEEGNSLSLPSNGTQILQAEIRTNEALISAQDSLSSVLGRKLRERLQNHEKSDLFSHIENYLVEHPHLDKRPLQASSIDWTKISDDGEIETLAHSCGISLDLSTYNSVQSTEIKKTFNQVIQGQKSQLITLNILHETPGIAIRSDWENELYRLKPVTREEDKEIIFNGLNEKQREIFNSQLDKGKNTFNALKSTLEALLPPNSLELKERLHNKIIEIADKAPHLLVHSSASMKDYISWEKISDNPKILEKIALHFGKDTFTTTLKNQQRNEYIKTAFQSSKIPLEKQPLFHEKLQLLATKYPKAIQESRQIDISSRILWDQMSDSELQKFTDLLQSQDIQQKNDSRQTTVTSEKNRPLHPLQLLAETLGIENEKSFIESVLEYKNTIKYLSDIRQKLISIGSESSALERHPSILTLEKYYSTTFDLKKDIDDQLQKAQQAKANSHHTVKKETADALSEQISKGFSRFFSSPLKKQTVSESLSPQDLEHHIKKAKAISEILTSTKWGEQLLRSYLSAEKQLAIISEVTKNIDATVDSLKKIPLEIAEKESTLLEKETEQKKKQQDEKVAKEQVDILGRLYEEIEPRKA